jgi:hypothetical protein
MYWIGTQVDPAKSGQLDHSYDLRVIDSASNAFFLQSQPDGFDERKRTFAYFVGIVRNKQKEIDEARLRARFAAENGRKERQEFEEHRHRLQREKAQEEEDLKSNPERVVLNYSRLLLSGGLGLMRCTWLQGLRKGLRALHSLGRAMQRILEQLAMTIQSWGKYSEELKRQMVDLLYAEEKALARLMPENRMVGEDSLQPSAELRLLHLRKAREPQRLCCERISPTTGIPASAPESNE